MDPKERCINCFAEQKTKNSCPACGYEEAAAETALLLAPRTILAGKYLIGRPLGQGGFGITYLAWDLTLDLKLAIKEFFPLGLAARSAGQLKIEVPSGERSDQYRYGLDRYLDEAKTLARFSEQPNIVIVRDFFQANNTAYMVMNYIEGLTLEAYLKQAGGKITFTKTVEIMMPALDALREVHRAGVMHRDISPDNIFINQDGRVILIDFGAARQEMREKSKSLSVILKAGYAPEEQYRSRGKQGPWTDIYAVAATMYRCIIGQVPLEAIDRLDEDDLTPPSQLGVTIEQRQEQVLLKALAVKAKDRYQSVDEFQEALIAVRQKEQVKNELEEEHKLLVNLKQETEKKLRPDQQPEDGVQKSEPAYTDINKAVIAAAAIILFGLLIFGAFSLFGGGDDAAGLTGPGAEEPPQTFDSSVISALDADYYIDYTGGTITLGDLPIGARVVDPSWEWEFRTGDSYTRESGDDTKPVTWLIVAKDHYAGLDPHVTLLSEELIGRHVFDDSTNRGSDKGSNHWGDSGTADATHGLRAWLNSSGIHSGEGFYRAFSEDFKGAVITTTVPNRERKNGIAYSTKDNVFLPSTTELGDTDHLRTYRIGSAYPYFSGVGDVKRIALLGGKTWGYWTRSPGGSGYLGSRVYGILGAAGEFEGKFYSVGDASDAYRDYVGVRPALNLKSGILVSEVTN